MFNDTSNTFIRKYPNRILASENAKTAPTWWYTSSSSPSEVKKEIKFAPQAVCCKEKKLVFKLELDVQEIQLNT